MENIAYSLLSKFKQERQRHPEQIIYYRDGVSEGEFPAILNHELSAIRRACARLKGGFEPKVTFIIAQKRHKTKIICRESKRWYWKNKKYPNWHCGGYRNNNIIRNRFFLGITRGNPGYFL